MSNRLISRAQLYFAGFLLSLALLSLVGANFFLSAQNRKLRLAAETAEHQLNCNSVRTELNDVASAPEDFKKSATLAAISYMYRKYHLNFLIILDTQGRTIVNQCEIPLTEEIARQISAAETLQQLSVTNTEQITRIYPIHNGEIVFSKTVIPSLRSTPQYIVLFAFKRGELDWTDSYEVWIAIMQLILIVCALSVAWYGIRKMTRPYEAILKEIYKCGPNNPVQAAEDELTFLVGSFKSIIQQLRDKEIQLNAMHLNARKRAEHSEQYARDILAGLHQAVICFDYKGIFLDANPTLEELLSLRRLVLKNRSYNSIFEDNSELVKMLDKFYSQKSTVVQNNLPILVTGHKELTVTASLSVLTDPQGAFYGSILVLEDETEKMRLRNLTQANDSLMALSVMAAGIAHEMKNGLAAISGNAQMILGNARPGAEHKRALALVREVESMTRVISVFLEYAKPLHPEKTLVQLDTLMEELISDYSERFPGIAWRNNLIPIQMLADTHLLQRAFSNLFLNAAQAIGARGSNPQPSGRVDTSLEILSGGIVRIRIEDNGIGIGTRDIASIFTPFFTTKAEGTGMGLPVVKKFLASHNGTIAIESTPEQGTEVEITFPPFQGKENSTSI